jgi:hypothetical protein
MASVITRNEMKKLVNLVLLAQFFMPLLLMASSLSEQAEELSSAFKIALDSQDYSKVEKLIYFEGVEQKTIDSVARHIKNDFGRKVKNCYVTEIPKDQKTEYRLNNKLYRTNLSPIGLLRVEFESNNNSGTPKHIASTYLVGKINGKYLITLAAPVE